MKISVAIILGFIFEITWDSASSGPVTKENLYLAKLSEVQLLREYIKINTSIPDGLGKYLRFYYITYVTYRHVHYTNK